MTMSEKGRTEIILEDINSKFDTVIEYVQVIPQIQRDITVLKDDVSELKSDMKIVKTVIREHSADIFELKAKTAFL